MTILSLQSSNTADKKILWRDSFGSGFSLGVAEVTKKHKGPVLVITSSARSASQIESEIAFFLGDSSQVVQFPDWETLPYGNFSPHQDIISKRLKTLFGLPEKSSGVANSILSTSKVSIFFFASESLFLITSSTF